MRQEQGKQRQHLHRLGKGPLPPQRQAPGPRCASSVRQQTSPYIDAEHDKEPLRFRPMDDIVGNTSPPGRAARVLDDLELHLGSAEEPPSFAAAEQERCWRADMLEEMDSIEETKTWELVDPSIWCRLIGLKWVFKVKRDE